MATKKGILDTIAPCTHPALEGVRQYMGGLEASGLRFGLVVSRFNTALTDGLMTAAVARLRDCGASPDHIDIFRVPGAFEIPCVLEPLAQKGAYDALIALGAVLEGATPHAQSINRTVTNSMNDIARRYACPVIDGVVVAHTMEQAEERCLGHAHNRGFYAAGAAMEMATIMRRVMTEGKG